MAANKTMSPARIRAMLKAVEEVRAAIDKRAQQQEEYIAKYDEAVASGDAKEIETASVMLMVMAGVADPVSAVIKEWGKVDRAMRDAE